MPAEHRDDIQGLRGVAVLLVVAFHAGVPFLSGGYVGVDIFFVISGYVICGVLWRELNRSSARSAQLDLVAFYARRMRRLLPAVTVVTLTTLGCGLLLGSPLEFKTQATSALATSLYASNLRFAFTATDYLGDSAETDPFLHTWSLGVEEQFYFVWPLLLLLLFRITPNRRKPLWVAAGILVIGLVSLLACDYYTTYNRPWGFFSPWTRAWEFALGAIAYCLTLVVMPRSRILSLMVTVSGFVAVFYATVAFDAHTRFPGTAAALPALGTFAILLGPTLGAGIFLGSLLRSAPLRLCGDVSYSWYLWHWPVLVFARVLFPDLGLAGGIVCSSLSFGLAWVTLVTIENPVRLNRFWALPPARSLMAGLGTTAATALCAGGIAWLAVTELATKEQVAIRFASDDRSITSDNCHLDFRETEQPECLFRPESTRKRVVLIGDSHARHWLPAFEALGRKHGWAVHSWTKSSCPPFPVQFVQNYLNRRYHECETWQANAMRTLLATPPDLVVLGSAYSYLRARSTQGAVDSALWWSAVAETLTMFDRAGIPALILGDTPWPGFDVPRCLSRAAWRGIDHMQACRFSSETTDQKADDRTLQSLAEQRPAVVFIPARRFVCDAADCAAIRDDVVVYRDHSHLTATFSRLLAKPLGDELMRHFPELFDQGSHAVETGHLK